MKYAIEILEHKLCTLQQYRKLTYKHLRRKSVSKDLKDTFRKWNKGRSRSIFELRKAIKFLSEAERD